MTSDHILAAKDLAVGYQGTVVVSGIELSLSRGELLAVVGHNGSGKSSLIKTLLGLVRPIAGTWAWSSGMDSKDIAYLGQRQDMDRTFPMSTIDLVTSGGWALEGWRGLLGGKGASDLAGRAKSAIERVGLSHVAKHALHQLSGGQLQRALFARAMVQDAPVVVLDEPFQGVDQRTEADLLSLVLSWVKGGKAVVLVSHDLGSALNHATHVLLLGEGQASFGEPCTVLTSESLVKHGYYNPGQAKWIQGIFASLGQHHG